MSQSSTTYTTTQGYGLGRAVVFGLLIAAIAAAITALVVFIKNDKDKNIPGYVPVNVGKNAGIAALIGFLIGFVVAALKHRIQSSKTVRSTVASGQKWWNTSSPVPGTVTTTTNEVSE